MVTHVVLYCLKADKKDCAQVLADAFLSMRGKIPVLRDIRAGTDFLRSERSFDVALICTFDTREALAEYAVHAAHLPVLAFAKTLVESSKSVDFEQ